MSNFLQQVAGKLVTDDQVVHIKSSLDVIGYTCGTISLLAFGVVIASVIFLILYQSLTPTELFGSVVTLSNSILMTAFFVTITYIVFQIQPLLFGKVGLLRNAQNTSTTFDDIGKFGMNFLENHLKSKLGQQENA